MRQILGPFQKGKTAYRTADLPASGYLSADGQIYLTGRSLRPDRSIRQDRCGAWPETTAYCNEAPLYPPSFLQIFRKMIGTMFNGDAGFKFAEIEADSRHYRVDVLQCPYMKYCELLGCKELTGTFCLSDDRVYGNMCGIAFERQGTIGRGSDKCDFYFYRK